MSCEEILIRQDPGLPGVVQSWSGGSTGLTPAAPTTGNIVLGGTLNVAHGGTDATTPEGASVNLNTLYVVLTNADVKALPSFPREVGAMGKTTAGDGGGGSWRLLMGDYSVAVAADPYEGRYMASDHVASSVAAWVRQAPPNRTDFAWYGATGGATAAVVPFQTAEMQAALNAHRALCVLGINADLVGSASFYKTNAPLVLDLPASAIADPLAFKRHTITFGPNSVLVVGFHGRGPSSVPSGNVYPGAAALQFGSTTTPLYQAACNFTPPLIDSPSSAFRNPVGIRLIGCSQWTVGDVRSGSWNNTVYQEATPQNLYTENLRTYGGGRVWQYKNPTGVRVQQTGTNLLRTAGTVDFTPDDVGHTFTIMGLPDSDPRRVVTVTNWVDATNVTVDISHNDTIPREIAYGSPHATLTAGSDIVDADASCFDANEIGSLIVFFAPWDSGPGAAIVFSAYIAERLSASQIRLDRVVPPTAPTTTAARFCAPQRHVYNTRIAGTLDSSSDCRFLNAQCEQFTGVGIVYEDISAVAEGISKYVGTSPTANNFSIGGVWANRVQGGFEGDFRGVYVDKHVNVVTEATGDFSFTNPFLRASQDQKFLYCGQVAVAGCVTVINNLSVFGASALALPSSMVTDLNAAATPGHVFTTLYSLIGQNFSIIPLGNGAYLTPDGHLVMDFPLSPVSGGTGVANNAASTLTRSGNHDLAITTTGATAVTFPVSGTLAILGANTFTGVQSFANGSTTLPSMTIGGTTTGFYSGGAGVIGITTGATSRIEIGGTVFRMRNTEVMGWCPGAPSGSLDAAVGRSAAAVVEVNNGTAGALAQLYAATVRTAPVIFSALPAAATAGAGARAFITDALAPAFLAVAVGGGAQPSPVVSDGTNWLIG